MGRDQDVDGSALDTLQRGGGFLAGAETRQRFDPHRPVREAISEVVLVLLREQRGRHQHDDLFAGLHGDEGRAHRDLRLAEADIAADHAVHRLLSTEIGDHLDDGLGLVGGLLEREAVGESLVFEFARRELQTAPRLALRVKIEQFGGHIAHLLGRPASRAGPLVGAEVVQRRGLGRTAGIARHVVQCVHRDIQSIAAQVLEDQELPGLAADLHRLQPDVAADPILLVHHRRAGGERLQIAQYGVRVGGGRFSPPAFLSCAGSEELRFREQRQ